MSTPITLQLRNDADRVDAFFLETMRARLNIPARLRESIEYSFLAGGKRLRPALVLECARAVNGDSAPSRSALAAAVAIELVHTFSLVHDDLPAMDDDDLRRGKLTNHKVFGEGMAILAGDAMMTLAFEIIATDAEPDVAMPLVRELARAAGPEGMIGGQVLDMAGQNLALALDGLQRVHRMKTGAMMTASCRLGGIASNATDTQLAALADYGNHLGLAFQIIDDILDLTATPEQLGKATNKDERRGKNTYPKLLGLEESRTAVQNELEAAMRALDVFGARAET
ncbi:MAG: polyprenyl synthetase family protein, partial [Chthoniobacterales bacterium]|nr:polyprenyl synthetase family protein [Chthoniobacterales bacterium]